MPFISSALHCQQKHIYLQLFTSSSTFTTVHHRQHNHINTQLHPTSKPYLVVYQFPVLSAVTSLQLYVVTTYTLLLKLKG